MNLTIKPLTDRVIAVARLGQELIRFETAIRQQEFALAADLRDELAKKLHSIFKVTVKRVDRTWGRSIHDAGT